MRVATVITAIQVIEIGIPTPSHRGEHLAFLKNRISQVRLIIKVVPRWPFYQWENSGKSFQRSEIQKEYFGLLIGNP
jgi:hypothetical protein